MNITDIAPRKDFILFVRLDDGRSGYFDVKPYLHGDAFTPLKDKRQFERVRNAGYCIEWECGADLSADTVVARMSPTPPGEKL